MYCVMVRWACDHDVVGLSVGSPSSGLYSDGRLYADR